ncbi:MAG: 4-hydroxy-tetrahydrodipicolinate synthase [Chloroflexi bacterium]|nr:4-hydroxy-tetrahydrodipicolinate synthase [Chloroflexota bacterium]
MKALHGIIVPIVTPFHQDETIDESSLRRLVRFLVSQGVHGIFPCGSQGEFHALTMNERRTILEVVLDEVNGQVLVLAHTGAITTRDSIDLTIHAASAGADAASLIAPFYLRPNAEELYRHFMRVAESTTIPVLAYNNPERAGYSIPARVIGKLAAQKALVGMKDSSGDLGLTLAYMEACPSDFVTFVGRDTLIYAALCCGCVGAVAATANVAPDLAVGIYRAMQNGDYASARELQRQLAPLRQAFALGTFPSVIKEALELVGQPVGPARAPVAALDEGARAELTRILNKMGRVNSL